MSTNTTAAVALEDSLTAKEKIAKMVGEKDEKDLKKSDRLYYGVPRWRGCETKNNGVHVLNSGFTMLVDNEQRYNAIMRNPKNYAELLQDQFYRHFMGYPEHFFKVPEHPNAIKVYNKVAVETGHPELVIGQIIYGEDKFTKANESSGETVEKIDPSKVDVVDNDGNVIATSEECAAAANTGNGSDQEKATEDSKPSKETEKKESEPKQPKQEKKEDKKPASDKKEAKETNSDAEASVIFYEKTPDGSCFTVDKDRHDGFKEYNKKILQTYPALQKVIDACPGKMVKLYNYFGLVVAEVFMSGIPGSINTFYIDPAKVRDHYSVILTGIPNGVFPFDFPMANFDTYLSNTLNQQLSQQEVSSIIAESSGDYRFLHHFVWSSVPKKDLWDISMILMGLFQEIDKNNLNLRFRAIDYTSKYSFTLLCSKTVSLAHFAKDNKEYDGLKIEVREASEKSIIMRVSGNKAKEFRDLIYKSSGGNLDMKVVNSPKTQEQKDCEKPNPENTKRDDKNAGSKKQESKQPKQEKPESKPKQQKQEKKEPEVNPADVVKEVEQEQKPQTQANEMSPEQKSAWDRKRNELLKANEENQQQKPEIQSTEKSPEEKAADAERGAKFAEAMTKAQQETTQIVEASNAIH